MPPPIIPGWYGKMPSLGDFSAQGLSPSFVSQWDPWLAQCMLSSQSALGEAWLDIYLTSPIWRFCLFPGVIGDNIWAGVLLPSVDRVGRYFPLTLAAAIPGQGFDLCIADAASWFTDLERQALATLEDGLSPDALARALGQHPFPLASAPSSEQCDRLADSLSARHSCNLTLDSLEAVAYLQAAAARRLLLKQSNGMSLWWSQPHPGQPVTLQCHRGLPAATHYAGMLDPAAHSFGQGQEQFR